MLELTVTAASAAELTAQIEDLRGHLQADAPVAEAPAAKEPAKGKGKAGGPKADPTPAKAAQEPQEAQESIANGIGYDQVKDAVIALHQSQGREAVLKVLAGFDVDHGSKLVPEQWPAALQALTEATMA